MVMKLNEGGSILSYVLRVSWGWCGKWAIRFTLFVAGFNLESELLVVVHAVLVVKRVPRSLPCQHGTRGGRGLYSFFP
jgi:hypothetical protein